MYANRDKRIVDHCVHLYSVKVAENPPMTGPRPIALDQSPFLIV
jgi:hypothetical protein